MFDRDARPLHHTGTIRIMSLIRALERNEITVHVSEYLGNEVGS